MIALMFVYEGILNFVTFFINFKVLQLIIFKSSVIMCPAEMGLKLALYDSYKFV